MTNLVETYINITAELEKLETLQKEARKLLEATYPNGFTNEKINIHFKENKVHEFSQDLQDLETSQKASLKKAKEMEISSGVATTSIKKVLTITIKDNK